MYRDYDECPREILGYEFERGDVRGCSCFGKDGGGEGVALACADKGGLEGEVEYDGRAGRGGLDDRVYAYGSGKGTCGVCGE
jgi:hypothetical protein